MGNDPSTGDSDCGSRRHQAFPTLDAAQIALMARYGVRRTVKAGEYLFHQGDRHIGIFVLLSGDIELTRETPLGAHSLGRHGPGMFTGEVGTLAGRAAIATAMATEDSEFIVIDEEALRRLVIAEAELSETMMRAFILRRVAYINDVHGGVILFGRRSSAETLRLRQFMARNGQSSAYFDINEHADAAPLMERFGITAEDVPAVVTRDGTVLRYPTVRQLADAIGLSPDDLDGKRFDLVVVGAGPAGLAAAVYAASEGLTVAVLDGKAPGGQAGASSRIENYFGFPTGISGVALAGRGLSQARKFGAEVAVPVRVMSLNCDANDGFAIGLDSGERIEARAIVIATGARYRKPDLPELSAYEGRGVYYSASHMVANFCKDEEVVVVGGGNSAGQAAVFLSSFAKRVRVMVRSGGLAASMSHYLIQRIEAAANITLETHTRIVELKGDGKLESIRIQHKDEAPQEAPVRHVFLFLGALPNTDWLGDCVALDAGQFVLTGAHIPAGAWPLQRAPHFLESSRPGIFAVGDVRSGSVKRVAAAVGEGSAAIQSLHEVLAAGN